MAKKRAGTLPLVTGPSFKLEPDHFNWKSLESAYGQRLPPEQRERIFVATQTHVAFRTREINAQPLRDSVRRVERLKKSAESFRKALVEGDNSSMAHVYAHHEIELQFAPDSLAGLSRVVESFVHACEIAITNTPIHTFSRPDGIAWRNWVIELMTIAQEASLPTGARNDTDKNKGGPSPFVRLVKELQRQLPKELQHERQSDDALARAINRARERYRRDMSNVAPNAKKSRKAK